MILACVSKVSMVSHSIASPIRCSFKRFLTLAASSASRASASAAMHLIKRNLRICSANCATWQHHTDSELILSSWHGAPSARLNKPMSSLRWPTVRTEPSRSTHFIYTVRAERPPTSIKCQLASSATFIFATPCVRHRLT